MTTGHATVTLDLTFEIDDDEFRRESSMEEGEPMNLEYIRDGIREQIEEAVKESGNGSSISLTFGDRNTEVIAQVD